MHINTFICKLNLTWFFYYPFIISLLVFWNSCIFLCVHTLNYYLPLLAEDIAKKTTVRVLDQDQYRQTRPNPQNNKELC